MTGLACALLALSLSAPGAEPDGGLEPLAADAGVPLLEAASPAPGGAEPGLSTVVTATRTARPLRDVPSTVIVLPHEELARRPEFLLDEALRSVPSVATFRRSSSLVADPTSQGLNLRGLGPSGISRTLVLLDGIPQNDPFGGWVFWRALPIAGLRQIEIAPQGSSAQYGSAALGGVVQLVSQPLPDPIGGPSLEGQLAYGLESTVDASVRGAARLGPLGVSLLADLASSDGYIPVAPAQRGEIDQPAHSGHLTTRAQLEGALGPALVLWATGGYFAEAQNGGTALTTSNVNLGDGALRARLDAGPGGTLLATAFARLERFRQGRSRVAADRASEQPAANQDVPANDEGLGLTWQSRALEGAGIHQLQLGIDGRRVAGVSSEALIPFKWTPASVVARRAGGEQRFVGVFAQDVAELTPALEVLAALRLDRWQNLRGAVVETLGDGSQAQTLLADRAELQLSPKLGARLRLGEAVTLRASGYRAFRAPTLNELYRPFQVGTVLTAANPALTAETVWGGELGGEVALGQTTTARLVGFWNALESPISNVTSTDPLPGGAQRIRENLGSARVRGLEASLEVRLARRWIGIASYTLVDSRVMSAPASPGLVGKRLAQDPLHRGYASISFDDPRLFTLTAQVRVVGPQFEDDLNTLGMAGALVVDLSAARRVWGPLEVFASVQNLLDRSYVVGRAGVDTLGQPFFARAGLRIR